jgi:HAMP domain-containing protein
MQALRLSFLRTRFGRRMLLLFLACAMLPLAALTFIVLGQTAGESERQLHNTLQRTAKAMGMSLVAELKETTDFSVRLANSRAVEVSNVMLAEESQRVRAALVLTAANDTAFAWKPEVFQSLTQRLSGRMDRKLVFRTLAGGAQVIAVKTEVPVAEHVMQVVVLLDAVKYFADTDVQSWLDSGMNSCAILDGDPIWCSLDEVAVSDIGLLGTNSVSIAGRHYPAARWSGFATFTGPAARLEVLTFSEPQLAFGEAIGFRRSLILLALASVVLVFLVSHAQLRRSLRPLEQLTDATERVGAQKGEVRVDVDVNDEFGVLARSFNEMSGRLASQVALLSTSAAISDEALRASTLKDLVPRLTTHVRGLLPREYGLSLSVRLEQTRWIRRSSMTRTTEWVEDEIELGVASLMPLLRGDLVAGRFGARDSQPYLRPPMNQTGWEGPAVAIPLQGDNELAGILTILVPDGVLATNVVLANVRSIAKDLALALNRTRLVGRLEQFNYGTLTALARTVDAKSPWTAGHSESVTYAAMCVGEHMRLPTDELDILHRGGLLHDIGKIAVPGSILDKPGRLTAEEMSVVQSHPEAGARILAPIEAYSPMIPIVLYHHERFDGTGYPHGLRGHAIPALARVVAVVDVFDALVSDRPYREGWLPERAAAHIQENAGSHFDPAIVTAFAAVEPQLRQWYVERRESERERRNAVPVTAATDA